MLKLDMAAFVNTVRDLPECPPEEYRPIGTAYLAQHVVLPFLYGDDVSLRELDFGAFDEDDIRSLWQQSTDAAEFTASILRLYQPMLSARAQTARAVRFI